MDDLVVTVLTGGRPALLRRTLDALEAQAGPRLGRWAVIALANGGDPPTLAELGRRAWIRVEDRPGPIRPIGSALSELVGLATASGRRFALHLEDDWACGLPPSGWLDPAAHALSDPNVGQVRLRLEREKVLAVHMATGRRIRWTQAADHKRGNAHYTFNPTLVRTEDLSKIFPCSGEREAQAKFLALGLEVVQLIPGAFRHLGDDASLRRRLGRDHG